MPVMRVILHDIETITPPAAPRKRFLFGVRHGVEQDVTGNAAKQRCRRMRRNGSDDSSNE